MNTEETIYRGEITFINFEKHFATIEYKAGTKPKAVNCKTDAADSQKKPHQYRLRDVVEFNLKLSARGDKMTAYNVKHIHNPAIDLLIQKAAIENRFTGYLKVVDGKFFVKEIESYILFPIQLSRWEKEPVESAANLPIVFKILNLEKPNSIVAELFSHSYSPEYKKALQHKKHDMVIESKVYKISPHGIFVDLFGEKMQAKIPLAQSEGTNLKEGDTLPVLITHLTPNRVVVKIVTSSETSEADTATDAPVDLDV